MADLVLRARRIITPLGERAGAVTIEAGRVVEVSDHADAPHIVEIGDECVLLPGLVDSHVHINDPGRTEWEGFATATQAAAAGGITALVDMPLNSIPATVDVDALLIKHKAAADRICVDVGFWGGAIPGNVAELPALDDAGVAGFKCFLAPSGVAEFPALDRSGLRAAMHQIAEFDGLLIAHAEDPALVRDAAGRRYADFLDTRPPEAEVSAIGWLIDAARDTGCRVHVVHLSAATALPMIAAARAEGVRLSAETCPHYLSLSAEQVDDGATQFKCCPPIRGEQNREQLWQGLADGLIDCVVSDHSPCTAELKQLDTGDFGTAWGGIASLQLALPVVWTEASRRGFVLADLVRWMSTAPAKLARLPAKGAIAPGLDADFAVFAPEEEFVVDPGRLRHRNPLTPYAGARLRGVVRETWLRGELIDESVPRGQLLRSSR
jgi:allantoinase